MQSLASLCLPAEDSATEDSATEDSAIKSSATEDSATENVFFVAISICSYACS